jgi:hypothetical protein
MRFAASVSKNGLFRNGWNSMHRILELPLWFGNARDAADVRRVMDAGVEAVVQVAAEEPPLTLPRDLIYCRIPLLDGADNPPKLLELAIAVTAHLLQTRTPTLVCCSSGLSRSPALTAAALARCRPGEGDAEAWLAKIAAHHRLDVSPALWNELHRS